MAALFFGVAALCAFASTLFWFRAGEGVSLGPDPLGGEIPPPPLLLYQAMRRTVRQFRLAATFAGFSAMTACLALLFESMSSLNSN